MSNTPDTPDFMLSKIIKINLEMLINFLIFDFNQICTVLMSVENYHTKIDFNFKHGPHNICSQKDNSPSYT